MAFAGEREVAEAEGRGSGLFFGVCVCLSVFPWPEQEEEGQDREVPNDVKSLLVVGPEDGSVSDGVADNGDVAGGCSFGWGINGFPGFEEGSKLPLEASLLVEARVGVEVSQPLDRLSNGLQGFLHCARLDAVAGDVSQSVGNCESLELSDGLVEPLKVDWHVVFLHVSAPLGKGAIFSCPGGGNIAEACVVFRNADSSEERTSELRWHSCHVFDCG